MKISILAGLIPAILFSCHPAPVDENQELQGATPVTVIQPEFGTISDEVMLNATAAFQVKIPVKSDINGYLDQVEVTPGQQVQKGQVLFVIKTREAAHLGEISGRDTSFRFSGLVKITAPVNGYVNQLSYAVGDYVQEGEPLVTISDQNSLVFLLELPYELKSYSSENTAVKLTLPDGKQIEGMMDRFLPTVDPVSQTQTCIIRVPKGMAIPENLVATVRYLKNTKHKVLILPREALLTNEVQNEFWVMKMADTATAVKITVQKGIESSGKVEIIGSSLSGSDRILISGNYGLPDTAKVIIKHND